MVLFNYSTKELTAKIVYYGPGLCGKTTNLQFIFENLPANIHKGKMLSLATKTDRTLFFDFLPIDLGTIRGMRTRLQLYTVPGQVFYNTTRKLVLKGADGLVFVADSQKKMLDANSESFGNMEQNLREHGMEIETVPHVLQFNKRDLKDILTVEELNAALNRHNVPIYEAVATTGIGVQDTLKAVTRLVLNSLREKYSDGKKASTQRAAAAAASRPAHQAASSQAAPREPLEVEPILELDEEPALAASREPEPVLALAADEAVEIEEIRDDIEEVHVLEVAEEEAGEAVIIEETPALDESSPLAIEEPEGGAPGRFDEIEMAPEAEEAPRGAGRGSKAFEMDAKAYDLPSPLEEPVLDGATVALDVSAASSRRATGAPPLPGRRAAAGASASREASFPLEVEVQGRTVRLEVTISVRVEKN